MSLARCGRHDPAMLSTALLGHSLKILRAFSPMMLRFV